MLAGFVAEEVILVDVHHQELVELHVLVALQGRAVAGPTQPLEVDAETLRELRAGQTRALRVGGGTREHSGPEAKPTRRGGGVLTLPSFSCLTNVVLWCSTFSPFDVPLASI